MKNFLITLTIVLVIFMICAVLAIAIFAICCTSMCLFAKIFVSVIFTIFYIAFWLFIAEVWL